MKSCVKDRLLAPFLPSPPRCCCFPFLEAFFLAPRVRALLLSVAAGASFLGDLCTRFCVFEKRSTSSLGGYNFCFLFRSFSVSLLASFWLGVQGFAFLFVYCRKDRQSISLSLSLFCCRTRVSVYLNAASSRAFGAESGVLEVCFVPGFC